MMVTVVGRRHLPSVDVCLPQRPRCSTSTTTVVCPAASANRRRKRAPIATRHKLGTGERVSNPRSLFPVRDDFIRSVWVQRVRTQRAQEYEELYPYFPATTAPATITDGTSDARPTHSPPPSPQAASASDTAQTMTMQQQPQKQKQKQTQQIIPDAVTSTMSFPTVISHMGVGTGPSRVAELRRAFRRLEPENMFRACRAEGESIWAYWGKSHGRREQASAITNLRGESKKGFVLIPENDLVEIRALEGALRHERAVLKAHCLVSLNEGEVSAHRPLEVTRMAMHAACDREMTAALREYRSLVRHQSNKKSVCHRAAIAMGHGSGHTGSLNGLVTTSSAANDVSVGKLAREAATSEVISELKRMPPGWRPLRWRMMRQEQELRNRAAEGEGMHREEMGQRLKERYLEAWERRHDYDLYCVLAGQFWPLEADAFRGVDRPGKKLFLEVDGPARKIAIMWKTCYPFRKDRIRKGCVTLQAAWRGYRVRKRWRPVLRIRLKHGRRACLGPCFSSWRRLARANRWARRRFNEMQGRWVGVCFTAWVQWVAAAADEKRRKLARAAQVMKNAFAYRAFRSWQNYVLAIRRAHRLFTRAVGRPALDAWIRHTDDAREARRRNEAAVTVERHVRGYRARVRFAATRMIIDGLSSLVAARKNRRFLRMALAAGQQHAAEELLQAGHNAEIAAGLAREERRLGRLQTELKAIEISVQRAVTRGWKTGWLAMLRRQGEGEGKAIGGRGGHGAAGGWRAGTRELRAEIKLVREEWTKSADKAIAETLSKRVRPGTVGGFLASMTGGGGGKRGTGSNDNIEGVNNRSGRKHSSSKGAWSDDENREPGGETEKSTQLSRAAPLAATGRNGRDQAIDNMPVCDRCDRPKYRADTSGWEKSADFAGYGNAATKNPNSSTCSPCANPAGGGGMPNSLDAFGETGGSILYTNTVAMVGGAAIARAAGDASYRAAVEREARRRIMSRELNLARAIVSHDFDTREPPPLKCCAPGCGRTFTQDAHYVEHWAGSRPCATTPLPAPETEETPDNRKGIDCDQAVLHSGDQSTSRRKAKSKSSETASTADGAAASTAADARATYAASSLTSPAPDNGSRPFFPSPTFEQHPSPQSTTAETGTKASPSATRQSPCPLLLAPSSAESGHPMLGDDKIAKFHLVLATNLDDSVHVLYNNGRGKCGRGNTEGKGFGFGLVSAYIRRVWGHGQAFNTLLFWNAVEVWRGQCATTEPSYLTVAIALRQRYLEPGSLREATLPTETRAGLCDLLDSLPQVIGVDVYDKLVSGVVADDVVSGDITECAEDDRNGTLVATATKATTTAEISVSPSRVPGSGQETTAAAVRPHHYNTPRVVASAKKGKKEKQKGVVSATNASNTAQGSTTVSGGLSIVRALRPTSFDEAQWQALAHLCRVVGPGFWASDLGRRYTLLRQQDLIKRRAAAHEIVRIERSERLSNEAKEIKAQMRRERESYFFAIVEPALDVVLGVVCEAAIRSAAAGAEQLAAKELEDAREMDMLSDAATVEVVWAVEPSFLEEVLSDELEAFCAERDELFLMASEDDWIPPELRPVSDVDAISEWNEDKATGAVDIDFTAIPGGEEGAATAAETIQCAWRQHSARVEARRRLAMTYVKRPAPGGGVYYEDTLAGTSQWERPLLATRLFPGSTW